MMMMLHHLTTRTSSNVLHRGMYVVLRTPSSTVHAMIPLLRSMYHLMYVVSIVASVTRDIGRGMMS